jgi:uncharacterized protein YjbI with pentapeptide repeats
MKKEIKHRFTGEVINYFNEETRCFDCANLRNADLSNANLWNADLSNANLSNADLRYANLSNADLRYANLSNADLWNANLSNANLWNANLWNANLSNANLWNAKNLNETIRLPMFCRWSHGITNGNLIHIGCEKRTIKDWDAFFKSDEVISTERNTDDFKHIEAIFKAYKAYLTHLNKK